MFVSAGLVSIEQRSSFQPTDFFYTIGENLRELAQRIHEAVAQSFALKLLVGSALGIGLGLFTCNVLTAPLLNWMFGAPSPGQFVSSDPFANLDFASKVLLFVPACLLAPVEEELLFRGGVHEAIKGTSLFSDLFSEETARKVALVAAIILGSILFGLIHFSNALVMKGTPIQFLPQVINATFLGVGLAVAKEICPESWHTSVYDFGSLQLPIYMHFGNNLMAWIYLLRG
jgi:membrane protease YdiL (CAAX protease family)